MENENSKESIAFVLGHTMRAMKQVLSKAFSDNSLDITPEQWHILMKLWKTDGITQNDLSYFVTKEKATVTRSIDGLEKRELIVRVQDKKDRRKNLIFLTDKGKELKDKTMPVAFHIVEKAVSGFSAEEIKTLKSYLLRLQENLKN